MSAAAGGDSFWSKTGALARKDLRLEVRGRDTLPPMLAFAFAVTLLLAFILPGGSRISAPLETPFGTVALGEVLAGFMWITVLFAGLIGFARTFEVEQRDGVLDAILMAPLDRSGLFVAKFAANLAYVLAVQVLIWPAFALFFGIDLGWSWLTLILVSVLVDVAFASAGTLFAALAAQTRSRELVLPILALPALVPVFIGATELTSDLLLGGGLEAIAARGWFGILLAFDVVFVATGLVAFDVVLD